MNKPNSNRVCRECGEPFLGRKAHAAFCSTTCRKTWNNRRATRGAQLYDAVMAMRYDREKAKELGIDWTFVCRMAEMWNGEDKGNDAPHGKSYKNPCDLKEELGAVVNGRYVCTDKTGRRA
jgi:hypothetical protein